MRGDTGARDYAWGAFAVIVGMLAVASVVVCVYALIWALVHTRWLGALRIAAINVPVSLLIGWWLAVGAWRRTVWGAPSVEEKAAAYEPLTPRQDQHLARMIRISLGCGIVLGAALLLQVAIARL